MGKSNLKTLRGKVNEGTCTKTVGKSYLQRPVKNDCRQLRICEIKITIKCRYFKDNVPLKLELQSPSSAKKEANRLSMHWSKINWSLSGKTKEMMDGLFSLLKQLQTLQFWIALSTIGRGRVRFCLCVSSKSTAAVSGAIMWLQGAVNMNCVDWTSSGTATLRKILVVCRSVHVAIVAVDSQVLILLIKWSTQIHHFQQPWK